MQHFIPSISFASQLQGNVLCFVFHGVQKNTINRVFGRFQNFCDSYKITAERRNIINGKCHYNIVVEIAKPRTDILPLTDWPMMITHLLQKEVLCDITYFDDYEKFLNK